MTPLLADSRVLARVFIPARLAAVCADCEAIFALNDRACPSCTSTHFLPLTTWFRHG